MTMSFAESDAYWAVKAKKRALEDLQDVSFLRLLRLAHAEGLLVGILAAEGIRLDQCELEAGCTPRLQLGLRTRTLSIWRWTRQRLGRLQRQ